MAKLTDTQLVVLSKAAARDDGLAVAPAKMNKAAATKVGSSLVARKLMRELKTKPGMPVWREDEDGRSVSLMITRAGRDAIGVETAVEGGATVDAPKRLAKNADVAGKVIARKHAVPGSGTFAPRAGSKQALVIEMLSGKAGATLNSLVEATGWLPHTTRAALTGLRKRGFEIDRTRIEGQESVYRIANPASAAAA